MTSQSKSLSTKVKNAQQVLDTTGAVLKWLVRSIWNTIQGLVQGLAHLIESILLIPSRFAGFIHYLIVCSRAPVNTRTDGKETTKVDLYGEWHAGELHIDKYYKQHGYRSHVPPKTYDRAALTQLRDDLVVRCNANDYNGLFSILRRESVRNLYRILTPSLYEWSNIQTEKVIHDFVREERRCIKHAVHGDIAPPNARVAYDRDKRQLVRDMRQHLGRTTLILQGGAMLSMCHVGVVRGLHRRRLLPRIITGTSSGALVAALVSTVKEEDLAARLCGEKVNVDAFTNAVNKKQSENAGRWFATRVYQKIWRRSHRLRNTGHLFDIDVLKQCAQDNLGDLTFEEGHALSGRVLNITIAMPPVAGMPQLLNHITTPHVLIRSAVVASLASSKHMYATVNLLCKDDMQNIVPYEPVDESSAGNRRFQVAEKSPLGRVGELFNVNHYIVSQTRPYISPFLRLKERTKTWPVINVLVAVVISEVVHWVSALRAIGLLPVQLQRVIMDEAVSSSATWAKVTIAPRLSFWDFFAVFDIPTPQMIDHLADIGERSIWPIIYQLKVRCAVELDLDAAFQADRKNPLHAPVNGNVPGDNF